MKRAGGGCDVTDLHGEQVVLDGDLGVGGGLVGVVHAGEALDQPLRHLEDGEREGPESRGSGLE